MRSDLDYATSMCSKHCFKHMLQAMPTRNAAEQSTYGRTYLRRFTGARKISSPAVRNVREIRADSLQGLSRTGPMGDVPCGRIAVIHRGDHQ